MSLITVALIGAFIVLSIGVTRVGLDRIRSRGVADGVREAQKQWGNPPSYHPVSPVEDEGPPEPRGRIEEAIAYGWTPLGWVRVVASGTRFVGSPGAPDERVFAFAVGQEGALGMVRWLRLALGDERTLISVSSIRDGVGTLTVVSGIDGRRFPPVALPPDALVDTKAEWEGFEELTLRHGRALAEWLRTEEGPSPSVCVNLADWIALQTAALRSIAAWRRTVDPAELDRLDAERMLELVMPHERGAANDRVLRKALRRLEKTRPQAS